MRERAWSSHGATLGVAVLGLGAGLSPLFSGYYTTGVWVPIGLAITVAAAAGAVIRPPRVGLPFVLTFTGIAGLGLWSLLSASWAHAAEGAVTAANRWLAYAALLLLLIVLLRSRRQTAVLLIAAGVGLAALAVSIVVRMLGSDPSALLVSGRLNAPLGYINGEGCVFAIGCWGGLALAERRTPVLAGVGAAAGVTMACLTLMSQSRGAAIATFAALIVVLAAVPGLRRRVYAVAVIAGGVALAVGPVVRIYSASNAGTLTSSTIHRAGTAIILSAALAGVVWAAVSALEPRLTRDRHRAAVLGRVSTAIAIVLLAWPVIVAAVAHSSIERTVRTQWHAFTHLHSRGTDTQTRLLSGSGNRYDYWRIAWKAFLAHPVAGVGAGNYPEPYYEQRGTTESIENPHSIELQVLSELGVVGAVLLVVMVVGVALGARRLRRYARRSATARSTMVAATGAAVAWLVDTSGDWMNLLPGVTALAVIAAAVLCRERGRRRAKGEERSDRRGSGLPTLIGAAAVGLILLIAGASLARTALVRHYLDDARSELGTRPAAAITAASRARQLDGANLDAYYVEAAGEARFNDASAARATLLAAADEDPESFITWTLLGDLEVRLHDFKAAKIYYRRARALDPRDTELASLARDPASALRSSSER